MLTLTFLHLLATGDNKNSLPLEQCSDSIRRHQKHVAMIDPRTAGGMVGAAGSISRR